MADDPPPLEDVGASLAALLERDSPIAVAFYPDHQQKNELVKLAEALAAPRPLELVHDVYSALEHAHRKVLLVLEPTDERTAVAELEQNRDRLARGQARTLLLLLRDGAGQRALADAPALASFLRETAFDMPRELTVRERAEAFREAHGMEASAWLAEWRNGQLADDLENNLTLGEALALEGAP